MLSIDEKAFYKARIEELEKELEKQSSLHIISREHMTAKTETEKNVIMKMYLKELRK